MTPKGKGGINNSMRAKAKGPGGEEKEGTPTVLPEDQVGVDKCWKGPWPGAV